MSRLHEAVFERSPIAMLLVTDAGGIEQVNGQAETVFGYARDELLGKDIETLVPEAIPSKHPALVRDEACAPSERSLGIGRELRGLRKDGSTVALDLDVETIEIEGDTLALVSAVDITHRRVAEQMFATAFEASPAGMIMVDSERRIQLCNQEISNIFGYESSELIGQPIERLVPSDHKRNHPGFVAQYLRNPVARGMGIGRELFGKHKSGRLIPVEIGLRPIVVDGEVSVVSSVVDISHRRKAERDLMRKTDEVEEFAYRTSHDLRSPLKSIAAMADCIAHDVASQQLGEVSQGALDIRGLAEKLVNVVEDILVLTRVDASVESEGAFNFDDYASTARTKFLADLAANGVRFECTFRHAIPLATQPARLTHLLDNLIGNAIKYRNPDQADSRVHLRTSTSGGQFRIEIEDNGIGIPAERTEDVFRMFRRLHGSDIPGSGLGLYIARKQATKIGAELSLESSPSGTTFSVELAIEN